MHTLVWLTIGPHFDLAAKLLIASLWQRNSKTGIGDHLSVKTNVVAIPYPFPLSHQLLSH